MKRDLPSAPYFRVFKITASTRVDAGTTRVQIGANAIRAAHSALRPECSTVRIALAYCTSCAPLTRSVASGTRKAATSSNNSSAAAEVVVRQPSLLTRLMAAGTAPEAPQQQQQPPQQAQQPLAAQTQKREGAGPEGVVIVDHTAYRMQHDNGMRGLAGAQCLEVAGLPMTC